MSSIGPTLPPHLAPKRKHSECNDEDTRLAGPPSSRSSSSDRDEKRVRVIGPALPPAALGDRLTTKSESASESESDDDDLGPAPPPIPGSTAHAAEIKRMQEFEAASISQEANKKPQREEWMLAPPSSDDWSSKVDPTKLKNRKFNTGKGSKAPQGNSKDTALWTETPEQKRKRLEDEVMGVKRPAQLEPMSQQRVQNEAELRETDRRIQEYNVRFPLLVEIACRLLTVPKNKNRNSSLYSEHKKTNPQEKEDDPSKRAFDREKDMGVGLKIGHSKRKELLTKAADFGTRFAKGNYL